MKTVFFSLCDVDRHSSVGKQALWWILITLVTLSLTVIPAGLLWAGTDVIEAAEALLISIGIRAIACLSKQIIEHAFKIINESKMTYEVRGIRFLTGDSPLEQYMWERSLRYKARSNGVLERQNEMASNPRIWFILIICSYLVQLAPDILGAGLISQTVPIRVPYPNLDQELLVPDFVAPANDSLKLRGNCVWSDGEVKEQYGNDVDSFGFLIFQFCLDVKNETIVDVPGRTLTARLGSRTVHAIFHLELITKDFFTERFVPFNENTIDKAKELMEKISSEKNVCTTEECRDLYRQPDDIFTYRVLKQVGLIKLSERSPLKGDEESRKKISDAMGKIHHRLTSASRAAFLVLVIAVSLYTFFSGISNSKESTNISLLRTIGELRGDRGLSFDTAIAINQLSADVNKHWSKVSEIPCYIKYDELDELNEKNSSFRIEQDEEGGPLLVHRGKYRLIKGHMTCAHYGFAGIGEDVSGLLAA